MNKSIIARHGSSVSARQAFIARFGEQDGKRFEEKEACLNKNDEGEGDKEDDNKDETERRIIKYSEAELADNPYLDTEYPMLEPGETSSAAPADDPLANMSLAELLKMGD